MPDTVNSNTNPGYPNDLVDRVGELEQPEPEKEPEPKKRKPRK